MIPAFSLHPSGASLRSVFAAARRSNCGMLTCAVPGVSALRAQPAVDLPRGRPAAWFIIPPSTMRIRFADYGGGGGIDSGFQPPPLRGFASLSLCRCAAVELRPHPTLYNENPLCGLWRRRWDSNPRNLSALRFSRPAQSTTLPPLQKNNSQQLDISDQQTGNLFRDTL